MALESIDGGGRVERTAGSAGSPDNSEPSFHSAHVIGQFITVDLIKSQRALTAMALRRGTGVARSPRSTELSHSLPELTRSTVTRSLSFSPCENFA